MIKCDYCGAEVNSEQDFRYTILIAHQNTHIIQLLSKIEARQDRLEKMTRGEPF